MTTPPTLEALRLVGSRPTERPTLMVPDGGRIREVDLRHVGFVSPLDLTALAAVITHAERLDNVLVRLPESGHVTAYLQRMDLVRHLRAAGCAISGTLPVDTRSRRDDVLLEVRHVTDAKMADTVRVSF